jgi:predicted O-methyltransferase YrrM
MTDSTAGLQAQATETYRRVPYPSLIHTQTHPDRLATVARLAGMDPPDIRTARVLEVGVADGLNLLAMAQALPDAQFVGIDLEPEGIARGRVRQAAAGIDNVRLEAADLMDGLAAIEGAFDYIVAHGFLAWVPAEVGEALMAMLAARLTPNGVAYVSFNAFPGCHTRMPIREAILRATAGVTDDAERLRRGRAAMERMAADRPGDTPLEAGMRAVVRARLGVTDSALLHDEFGQSYRPHHLHDVLQLARAHGLKFLGDASAELIAEAAVDETLSPPDLQAFVETRACDGDDAAFRFFRRALLVRDSVQPTRRLDPRTIERLWAMSSADEIEPNIFASGNNRVRCDHAPLVDALRRLRAAFPARVPVAELGLSDGYLKALVGLFDFDMLALHTVAAPWAVDAGERPCASPLARAMVAEGPLWAVNLDHQPVRLSEETAAGLRQVDGSLSRAELIAKLATPDTPGEQALGSLAAHCFLLR